MAMDLDSKPDRPCDLKHLPGSLRHFANCKMGETVVLREPLGRRPKRVKCLIPGLAVVKQPQHGDLLQKNPGAI